MHISRPLESRSCRKDGKHAYHKHRFVNAPDEGVPVEIHMDQLLWGLTCIQYHQGVRICIPSLLGKNAARASAISASLSESGRVPCLDVLSYRTGDETTATVHYLWIAILNKKIYIGLPNSPSMTSRVWSAIFEYLGKSLERKDRASVDVVLIATQHNINPISGILSLAYISLLAQGTDPFSISNLIFHEGRLLSWFSTCYNFCEEDGSSSCLLFLSREADYRSQRGTKHLVRRHNMRITAHPERKVGSEIIFKETQAML